MTSPVPWSNTLKALEDGLASRILGEIYREYLLGLEFTFDGSFKAVFSFDNGKPELKIDDLKIVRNVSSHVVGAWIEKSPCDKVRFTGILYRSDFDGPVDRVNLDVEVYNHDRSIHLGSHHKPGLKLKDSVTNYDFDIEGATPPVSAGDVLIVEAIATPA